MSDNTSVNSSEVSIRSSASNAAQFIVLVVAFMLNSAVLGVLCHRPSFRTPFNTILANLFLANLFYTLIMGFFCFQIAFLDRSLWYIQSNKVGYAYAIRYAGIIQVLSHAGISINRSWAVTWPYSYKRHFNQKTSLLFCASIWVTGHLVALPRVLYVVKNYLMPDLSAEMVRTTLVQFTGVSIEVAVLIMFPYIWYKRRKILKKVSTVLQLKEMDPPSITLNSSLQALRRPEFERSNNFLLLVLTTTSLFLAWTPAFVADAIATFRPLPQSLRNWCTVVYAFQAVLDPLLFAFTAWESQKYIKRTGRNINRT